MISEAEKRVLAAAQAAMDEGHTMARCDVADILDLLDQLKIARRATSMVAREFAAGLVIQPLTQPAAPTESSLPPAKPTVEPSS